MAHHTTELRHEHPHLAACATQAIVTRQGCPATPQDLARVGASRAGTVIWMMPERQHAVRGWGEGGKEGEAHGRTHWGNSASHASAMV